MKSILLVGSNGMLAHDLLEVLERAGRDHDLHVHAADLPDLDITDLDGLIHATRDAQPDIIFNCAAWTDVDACEADPERANAVNATGPENLAQAANDAHAKLVHVSTDFVFDGTKEGAYREDDEPAPLGAYGASKLEGEKRVADTANNYLIVRTAWLFGVNGKCFPKAILKQAADGRTLKVVDDQRGSPTHALDLADALWTLVRTGAKGLFHAAGSGSCTWFEFAEEICRQARLDVAIDPIDSRELNRPAPRPANSVLDSTRLVQETGFEFPSWRQSLGVFLTRMGY